MSYICDVFFICSLIFFIINHIILLTDTLFLHDFYHIILFLIENIGEVRPQECCLVFA